MTITVKPDRHYEVDEVIVRDSKGKQLAVKDNGDGTYRPEKVYITTGNSSLTSVEVLEGLNEGDIVITNPPANIDNMTSASLILA